MARLARVRLAPAAGRIGLLGGSFNPAHDGHRHVSLEALKRLRLDRVWWLVSPQNPLKDAAGMAPLADRLAAAGEIARHPRIAVTALEAELGTRYTLDSVRALKRRFPAVDFVWLCFRGGCGRQRGFGDDFAGRRIRLPGHGARYRVDSGARVCAAWIRGPDARIQWRRENGR